VDRILRQDFAQWRKHVDRPAGVVKDHGGYGAAFQRAQQDRRRAAGDEEADRHQAQVDPGALVRPIAVAQVRAGGLAGNRSEHLHDPPAVFVRDLHGAAVLRRQDGFIRAGRQRCGGAYDQKQQKDIGQRAAACFAAVSGERDRRADAGNQRQVVDRADRGSLRRSGGEKFHGRSRQQAHDELAVRGGQQAPTQDEADDQRQGDGPQRPQVVQERV
jgi:hypothetical protein